MESGSPHVLFCKRTQGVPMTSLKSEKWRKVFRRFPNGWMRRKPKIIPKRSKIVVAKCYQKLSILGHKISKSQLWESWESQDLGAQKRLGFPRSFFKKDREFQRLPEVKIRHWSVKSLKLKLLFGSYKRSNQTCEPSQESIQSKEPTNSSSQPKSRESQDTNIRWSCIEQIGSI